jgi:FkbM family methyltransferase
MILNTRTLFKSILWNYPVDCICDIGSRDGEEAIIFRNIISNAEIIAFEANEFNYKRMSINDSLRENKIKVYPFAISNYNGIAHFNIVDPDDNQAIEIKGSSSLKENLNYPNPKKTIVETRRLDDFITNLYPALSNICLWIDVEGAEYEVIQGITNIKHNILAIHVETAIKPQRVGQQTLNELDKLCAKYGFKRVGKNFNDSQQWGDVVYFNNTIIKGMKKRLFYFQIKSYISRMIIIYLPFIRNSKYYINIKKLFKT